MQHRFVQKTSDLLQDFNHIPDCIDQKKLAVLKCTFMIFLRQRYYNYIMKFFLIVSLMMKLNQALLNIKKKTFAVKDCAFLWKD